MGKATFRPYTPLAFSASHCQLLVRGRVGLLFHARSGLREAHYKGTDRLAGSARMVVLSGPTSRGPGFCISGDFQRQSLARQRSRRAPVRLPRTEILTSLCPRRKWESEEVCRIGRGTLFCP